MMNTHTAIPDRVMKRYRLWEAQQGEAMRNAALAEGHRVRVPSKMPTAQTGVKGIKTEAVFDALSTVSTTEEIRNLTGMNRNEVNSALTSLKIRGRVVSEGVRGKPYAWSRT